MLTILLLLITISLYVFPAYAQVTTNGTKTWLDRENNIKILFRTIPEQPTIGTTSTLRFTVQNLQTGKPVTNLLANVVIVGGTINQEAPIPFPNISAVDGNFSIDVIFPNKGSYQVITKITSSRTHDVASLASFTVTVPAPAPAMQYAFNLSERNYIIWVALLTASAVGVASFLILKNKNKSTIRKD
jgi:hypothetical protein